jgi:serine/threonine protein kinase
MIDRTINDSDQGHRSVNTPVPENVYGRTIADGAAGAGVTPAGPAAGASVGDAYQVVHPIGTGGMGTISLAKHLQLNRWVALKRMSPEFADDSRLLERFRTEARAVAALNHFHIVHVYAMAEDEEGPYTWPAPILPAETVGHRACLIPRSIWKNASPSKASST